MARKSVKSPPTKRIAKPRRVKTGYVVEEFDQPLKGYGNLLDEKLTGLQAIKHFCVECQGGHYHDWRMSDGSVHKKSMPLDPVRECVAYECWLYPYRMGTRPSR